MPNPKLSTLVDSFTGASINASLWNASSGGGVLTLDTVNNRVQIAVGTTASTYNSLGASGPYDATASSLYARVGAAPNGAGGVQTTMKLAVDASNSVLAQVASGGTFVVQVQTAGTYVTTALPAYSPYLHAWWQLAEAGGSFTFSTSADGVTWTALATVAHSWSAAAMMVYFQTGATDTEPAGQQAWIAHVNTPRGGAFNSNWPVMEYGWGPRWTVNAGAVPADQYVDVTSRTRRQQGFTRGRQYELDQVRSGSMAGTWRNSLGEFDPSNTSGPWYGHVQLYQPLRVRGQWPPTINLLTQAQASGGDLGGYSAGTIPASAAIYSDTDSSGGSITASGSAWQGGSVLQFAVPAASVSGAAACYTAQPGVEPGVAYAQQLQVRNVTATTNLQVQAFITFWSASRSVISTNTGTAVTLSGGASAAWSQITVAATAPAGTAYWTLGVRLAATSPGSSVALQVDGWQLERGSAASGWTVPGVWSPVFGGFVDRYPQAWEMAGTFGIINPTAYDSFSLLSQRLLRAPLVEEIYSRNPRYVYGLGDPQGSVNVADSAGNLPPATIAVSKYGAGALTLGTQITAANPATGIYTGSTGATVAELANPNPGTSTLSAATYVDLHSAGVKGPSGGTWSRMIAFRYTGPTPSSGAWATIWAGFGSNYAVLPIPGGSQVAAYIDNSGHVNAAAVDDSSSGGTLTDTSINVVDSNWHLLIWGVQAGQKFMSVDGNYTSSATGYGTQSTLIVDNLGAWVDTSAGRGTSNNFQGDISFATEWPSYLSSTDCSKIYSAWKNSFAGDSSNARYARILGWAGYTGLTSLQAGLTTSMGPAVVAGQDALTALQAVVDSENGAHFVARDGTVTFKARSDRYNKLVPTYTFGERADLGEIPYEGLAADYDPTRIANQVTITQQSSNQTFPAQDTASINAYFPRALTRTVNSSSTQECQAAADYLVSRYRQPAVRISSLILHPAANPAVLWPVCLALELGTRIRVMRRPPNLSATVIDCFVESLVWRFDDHGEAFLTIQCSPVDLAPYGIFASFHTTLASNVLLAATTVTINTGADTTNVARAQLASGQQLILGLGTSRQETVTIAQGGVPVTTPSWTTCTITLTAPTVHSHSASDVVCEPLPAGITDPTTWDATSQFDAAQFAY